MLTTQQLRTMLYNNRGVLRRVPPGWEFPKGTYATVLQHWLIADTANRVATMRLFKAHDANHLQRGTKKLRELRWLTNQFEAKATALSVPWPDDTVTAVQVRELYDLLFDSVVSVVPGNNRGLGMLTWQTVHNKIRDAVK